MQTRVAVAVLAVLSQAFLVPQALAAPPPVSIEAVSIGPPSPAPGVLCSLGIRLKNAGTHTATGFRFRVKIDGQEETVYRVELFAVNVAPGASDTIALHNFWTAAAPKTSFEVEVTLLEGEWAEVKREGNTSTTTPLGPIEGLPVSATQSVHTAAAK